MPVAQVTGLTTYPVKSMGGEDHERAEVTPQGLRGDRRWMLLDAEGHLVSARECHPLLGLSAMHSAAGVRIRTRGGEEISVAVPGTDAPRVATSLRGVEVLSVAAEEASAWISARLGRPLRLAHQHDPYGRDIGKSHGGMPGESMSLADAGPVLLVNEASVARVVDWVGERQQEPWLTRSDAAQRFRPNIVIAGDEPFAEDHWLRVRIGDVIYRRSELCDRCVLTTIDLQTLRTTKEPIRTLASHRRWNGKTWFGVRLIPEMLGSGAGSVTVGDEVQLLEGG